MRKQGAKYRRHSRDGARKRVHAQRDAIDKGLDGKADGCTCNEKVFRFRVCDAPVAIRIALELARKGGVRGGSST